MGARVHNTISLSMHGTFRSPFRPISIIPRIRPMVDNEDVTARKGGHDHPYADWRYHQRPGRR
jgi:hypothetical protein